MGEGLCKLVILYVILQCKAKCPQNLSQNLQIEEKLLT